VNYVSWVGVARGGEPPEDSDLLIKKCPSGRSAHFFMSGRSETSGGVALGGRTFLFF